MCAVKVSHRFFYYKQKKKLLDFHHSSFVTLIWTMEQMLLKGEEKLHISMHTSSEIEFCIISQDSTETININSKFRANLKKLSFLWKNVYDLVFVS